MILLTQARPPATTHSEPIITSDKLLHAGHDFINMNEIIECVEWVCPDTAHWLRAQFRYDEAAHIFVNVHSMKPTL